MKASAEAHQFLAGVFLLLLPFSPFVPTLSWTLQGNAASANVAANNIVVPDTDYFSGSKQLNLNDSARLLVGKAGFSRGAIISLFTPTAPGHATEEEYREGIKRANKYNNEDSRNAFVNHEQNRWEGRPPFIDDVSEYSSGHSAKVPDRYGLAKNGLFIAPNLEYAYATTMNDRFFPDKGFTYFSPYVIDNFNQQEFNGLLVHEMTHAYDIHMAFKNNLKWNRTTQKQSEGAAYRIELKYYKSIWYWPGSNKIKDYYYGNLKIYAPLYFEPPWLK